MGCAGSNPPNISETPITGADDAQGSPEIHEEHDEMPQVSQAGEEIIPQIELANDTEIANQDAETGFNENGSE